MNKVNICRGVNHHGEKCPWPAVELYGWPAYFCSLACAARNAILAEERAARRRRELAQRRRELAER